MRPETTLARWCHSSALPVTGAPSIIASSMIPSQSTSIHIQSTETDCQIHGGQTIQQVPLYDYKQDEWQLKTMAGKMYKTTTSQHDQYKWSVTHSRNGTPSVLGNNDTTDITTSHHVILHNNKLWSPVTVFWFKVGYAVLILGKRGVITSLT